MVSYNPLSEIGHVECPKWPRFRWMVWSQSLHITSTYRMLALFFNPYAMHSFFLTQNSLSLLIYLYICIIHPSSCAYLYTYMLYIIHMSFTCEYVKPNTSRKGFPMSWPDLRYNRTVACQGRPSWREPPWKSRRKLWRSKTWLKRAVAGTKKTSSTQHSSGWIAIYGVIYIYIHMIMYIWYVM